MDTLIFYEDLHAITLSGIENGVIKTKTTEYPVKVFLKDDTKEWEFVLFSPKKEHLLLKSVFKSENTNEDRIPIDVLNDIKEIIDGIER